MKRCPNHHITTGMKFCTQCGEPLVETTKQCANCNAPVIPGQNFCGECGTKVESSPISTEGRKDGCNDGTPQELALTSRKKIKLALRLEVAIKRSEKRIMQRLDEFDRKVMARLGDGV